MINNKDQLCSGNVKLFHKIAPIGRHPNLAKETSKINHIRKPRTPGYYRFILLQTGTIYWHYCRTVLMMVPASVAIFCITNLICECLAKFISFKSCR